MMAVTRIGSTVLTQRERMGGEPNQGFVLPPRKRQYPMRLQCSSGHSVKHVAKPQAKKWPANTRRIESKRPSYKPLKSLDILPAQVEVILNFVGGRDVFAIVSVQALARVYATLFTGSI